MADRKLNVDVVLKSNKAKQELADLEKQGNSTANKLSSGFKGLQGMFKSALGVGAVVAGLNLVNNAFGTLAGMFKEGIQLAQDQTSAVVTLNAALQANGNYTVQNSQAVQAYASELQQLVGVGDEVLIGVAAQVEALTGLGTDVMPDVMKAAVQLSTILGKDLNVAAEMLAKQLNGDTDVLKRYIGATKEAGDVNATLANILDKTSAGMEIAIQKTNTYEGANTLLTNAWGDLLEELGFYLTENPVVIQAIKDTVTIVIELTKVINENRKTMEVHGRASLLVYADVLQNVGTFMIAFSTGLQTVVNGVRLVVATNATAVNNFLLGINIAALKTAEILNFLPKVNIDTSKMRQNIDALKVSLKESASSVVDIYGNFAAIGFESVKWTTLINSMADGARDAADSLTDSYGTGVDLFGAIEDITNDNTGTGKMKKDLKEVSSSMREIAAFANEINGYMPGDLTNPALGDLQNLQNQFPAYDLSLDEVMAKSLGISPAQYRMQRYMGEGSNNSNSINTYSDDYWFNYHNQGQKKGKWVPKFKPGSCEAGQCERIGYEWVPEGSTGGGLGGGGGWGAGGSGQSITKGSGFDLFGQGIVPLLSAGFANINGQGGFGGGVRNSLGGVLGGIANSILPAPFGGLVGSLIGGLFKKKSKPTTKAEAIPVKVINFSDLQSSLLNTTKQSLVGATSGNISRLDRMRVAQAATGI